MGADDEADALLGGGELVEPRDEAVAVCVEQVAGDVLTQRERSVAVDLPVRELAVVMGLEVEGDDGAGVEAVAG